MNRSTTVVTAVLGTILILSTVGCASRLTDHKKGTSPRIDHIQPLWNLNNYTMNVCIGFFAPYADEEQMVAEALELASEDKAKVA